MHSNTRFHQILEGLSRSELRKFVQQSQSDRYSKQFKTYDHLIALIYAQLSGVKSLRELEVSFNAHRSHHSDLETQEIKRSTLSDANHRRSTKSFQELVAILMTKLHRKQKRELQSILYLLDSTPIQLKGRGFEWALPTKNHRTTGLKVHVMINSALNTPVYVNITNPKINDINDARQMVLEKAVTYVFDKGYYDYNWWHRITQTGALFVTRFKSNAALEARSSQPIDGEVILCDEQVVFKYRSNRGRHKNAYGDTVLRRITVAREGKKPLILATNNLEQSAEEIALLYKTRWQIELFFKWLKQNLKLKVFLGRSQNAVMLQIYAAIISYLLLWEYKMKYAVTAKSLHLLLVELRGTLFMCLSMRVQRKARKKTSFPERSQENVQYEFNF